MNHKLLYCLVFLGLLSGCSSEPEEAATDRVNRIANEFVDAYYDQFPDEVYEVGYPDAPMNRFGDHSPDRLELWDGQVDGWLADLDGIDVEALGGTAEAVTYVFTRERLQAIVDRRACKMDLWNVSPTWTGWQYSMISTLAVQPVATETERADALNRAADIERYLKTEVSNLRAGTTKATRRRRTMLPPLSNKSVRSSIHRQTIRRSSAQRRAAMTRFSRPPTARP